MVAPEAQARQQIDRLLEQAGWHICDADQANIHAAQGVAIREFPLPGQGFADYLLYIEGKAAGVIEAKKQGATLSGVEIQSDRYAKGLPSGLPRWGNPLPFAYQSTGTDKSAGQPIWSHAVRPKGGDAWTRRRQFQQQYASPYNNFKFTEEYAVHGCTNVARGQEPGATIVQRIYSILNGRDLLLDRHANGGDRVVSRSTNPMTSLHC